MDSDANSHIVDVFKPLILLDLGVHCLSSKPKYENGKNTYLNISIIYKCEMIVLVRLGSFIVGGSLITSYVPIGPNVFKLWYIKVVTVTEEFDVVYREHVCAYI